MFDLQSPKVMTPAVLFALLSPGMILQLPDKVPLKDAGSFFTMKTSYQAIAVHAFVFAIVYKLVAQQMGINISKVADLLVPMALFVILSPGLLLQLPSLKLFTGSTSVVSVLIHALVFAVLFAFLRSRFPQFY